MSNNKSYYKDISEINQRYYHQLISRVEEFLSSTDVQPQLALLVCKYIIYELERENRETLNNMEWIERRLDNQNKSLDSTNKTISFLVSVIVTLGRRVKEYE